MAQLNQEIIVISDTGFAHEIEPLIKHYGPENFLLFRVHRKGYDFGQDSRSYITFQNGITPEIDIHNLNIDDLREDVLGYVGRFLKGNL